MQRASIRWKQFLVVGVIALLGCERDASNLTSPLSGKSATKAAYAYSTPYGEMWEVDGELYPAGYANAWNAVITSTESWTEWQANCASFCSVQFNANMTGLWHMTQQTIHWQVGDAQGSAPKPGFGWNCAVRVSPINCMLAERTDYHRVTVDRCTWTAKVNSDHEAWWAGFFDLAALEFKPGRIGRSSASSLGLAVNYNHCGSNSSGGGFGQVCYEYYLVWTDRAGYHEEYLGTECFGSDEL